MAKLSETFAAYVAAKVRAGADVDPALRLVGRDALARLYRERVAPWSATILAAVDVPTIHFGTGRAPPARGPRGGRRRRDRARLAPPARRRLGARRPTAPCRATSTRRRSLAPWERRRARGARRAGARGRPAGPHLQPRPRRAARDRPGRAHAPRGARPRADGGEGRGMTGPAVILMAYGSPDRLADVPAYYADIRGGRPIAARAPRRPRRALPRARDRRLGCALPAQRDHRGDARRARARARPPGAAPACATGSRGSRTRSRRRSRAAATRSSGSCSRRTGRRSRSRSTRQLFDDAVAGRAETRFVRAVGRRPGLRRAARASAFAVRNRTTRTSSSPRTRCRRGSSTTGDPYRDELLETRRARRRRRGDRRLVVLLPERVADGRAVARPGHPRPPRRPPSERRRRRARLPGRASSPTTSRSAGTSTSRRWSGRASSACGSRGSRCRTPTRPSSRCSRASSAASSPPSRHRGAGARGRGLGRRRLAEVRRPRARDAHAQGASRRARAHGGAGGLGAPRRLASRSRRARRSA